MQIGLAQINPLPLAFDENVQKALSAYRLLVSQGADIVVFPELTLWGYNADDFFFSSEHHAQATQALENFTKNIGKTPALIGSVYQSEENTAHSLFNAVFWCQEGAVQHVAKKCRLPYYDIFNEKRYFTAGEKPLIVDYQNEKIGILICEDAWTGPFSHHPLKESQVIENEELNDEAFDPVQFLADEKVTCVVNLSASPWSHDGIPGSSIQVKSHAEKRLEVMQRVARLTKAPAVYCNLVGGREEAIFDGRSFCLDARGEVTLALNSFKPDTGIFNIKEKPLPSINNYLPERWKDIHQALVFGIREYAHHSKLKQAVIGLSGGIDSALVALLATEALGPENVLGVSLPSVISSDHSKQDAKDLAHHLGIAFKTIPIEAIVSQFEATLSSEWQRSPSALRLAHENLQARIRGNLLMALSNAENRLLLTTGNKSELAMGYGTLYGDMCGGLNPIGDLYKCEVYELAYHLKGLYEKSDLTYPIPLSTLTKEPSAELSPGQKDTDSLPPYSVLDPILKHYIEDNWSMQELIDHNFDATIIKNTLRRIQLMEYKRHQSPPILRCRPKAFGMGRRIPLINGSHF